MCYTRLRVSILYLFFLLCVAGCSRGEPEDNAQSYLERSEAYIAQGQYRAALIETSNAMASAPDNIAYRVAMADIYNILGAGRRASELLEPDVDIHRQDVSLTLAKAYLLQGKFLSAREVLERFEPHTDSEVQQQALYLADSARIQGHLETARDAYLSLLSQYPNDRAVRRQLSENYLFMGELDQAQKLIGTLLEEQPRDVKALHLDAAVALRRNDHERAERQLSTALIELPRTDIMLPERAAVLQLLVETLVALGRSTEALVYQKVLADGAPEGLDAQHRLQQAVTAVEEGRLDEAEQLLQSLLEKNPGSRSAAVMLGVVNLSQGDVDTAEQLLTQNVDVETANTDVIRATVLAQAELGKDDLALQTLERALQARPNDSLLHSIHGLLALSLPEHQEAGYLSLQKAVAQEPQSGRLRLALARYHNDRGESEQALAQLRRAFSLQPNDWPVTTVYLNQLFTEGKLAEVKQALDELEQRAHRAPQTQLFAAQYLFRSGDQEAGIQNLNRLLESEPTLIRGHGVLAQMYAESGQVDLALGALEKMLFLDPDNARALQAGVDMLAKTAQAQTAEQWLAGIVERNPNAGPNARAIRAMALRARGDLAGAAALLGGHDTDTSDYLQQTRALIDRDLAQEYAAVGEYDMARGHLLAALRMYPNSLSLNLDLAQLELIAGQSAAASMLLDDLESRHPSEPRLAILQAQLIAREQGVAQGFARLKTAWDKQPDSQLAPLLVTWADQQEDASLSHVLKQWQVLDPNGRERLLYMAERAQRDGDRETAEEYYERVLAVDNSDVVALNNLAWLLKQRNPSRAETLAERALSLQPDSASILDTYGWILHLQGHHQRALEHLARAAQLAPDSVHIQANLNAVREAL